MTSTAETIEAYRSRYEALKSGGQALKTLPGPSRRPPPAIAPDALLHKEIVPGGWYWSTALLAGETLRLQTTDVPGAVALVAWRRDDPSERLNYPDTIKIQWTTALGKGRVIFSDMGRVMLSIVEDSSGYHDTLVGGSTAASNAARFSGGPHRNTRDNFLLAAAKLGLDARDVPACFSFFAPVRVDGDGRFGWHGERRSAGDFVDLRAEMDLLVAISNCPHPIDPAMDYAPGAIEAYRFRGPAAGTDDLCRTASEEARRGFENNAAANL